MSALLHILDSNPPTFIYQATERVITTKENIPLETEDGKIVTIPSGCRIAIKRKSTGGNFLGTVMLECIDKGIPVMIPSRLVAA